MKEPTSKNQKATSLWMLGCHKPVIPVVTFLTNSSLKLLKTKGLKLTSMMPLNSITWIIMHHSRSWSTFTLDSLLTVTNFIHRNLFNHQPFEWFINYHQYYQVTCKKRNRSLDNIVIMKITMMEMNKKFSSNILTLRP